jgi:hypothetical protein
MPEWSRDGRWLYFCSAPQLPEKEYRTVRCDLMRIGFDPQTRCWGALDTVLLARDAGGSVLQPRWSPDGRFLLVNVSPYGDFPIDKAGTRLCIFDPRLRRLRVLDSDSLSTDAWHGWSSNGKWIVFNSKRLNKRFSSIYFCYVDTLGTFHKPFVLPCKDPEFYDYSLSAFNVPEFTTSRIACSPREIQNALDRFREKPPVEAVTSASVKALTGGEF